MDTIKNYLETMFASMPNTAEVRKAKAELLQMMEDKYNELISEVKAVYKELVLDTLQIKLPKNLELQVGFTMITTALF